MIFLIKSMSMKQLFLRGTVLALVALLPGCSFLSLDSLGFANESHHYSSRGSVNECNLNRSICMHEGQYESGEQYYAEQAAKRLNQASLERFRRSAAGM